MNESIRKVRIAHIPTYYSIHQVLTILNGSPRADVISLIETLWGQRGTPQNPVDWSDPDTWITQRLPTEPAKLASRIWEQSNYRVNPRHIRNAVWFTKTYHLMVPDASGIYRLTDRGQAFLNKNKDILRELDDAEGLLRLLEILATKTRPETADLLPEWTEFLREFSEYQTQITIGQSLRFRLRNLIERKLVVREGFGYALTEAGLEYVASSTSKTNKGSSADKRSVLQAIDKFNTRQREVLREHLSKMDPYQFEHLVRDLLEAMGYEDVRVTKESGDKGIDVVATVQFGITTITEFVQVKRHQGSIQRPILDQLRGALPYFKALRGTIITLGDFSKGCADAALFPGAAPITLINGDRLLDLLFKYKIGIRDYTATLYELDADYFANSLELQQVNDYPILEVTSPDIPNMVTSSADERLAKIRANFPKAYELWTEAEDTSLRDKYEEGTSIELLSTLFQRQPSAIRARLRKLHLIS